MVKDFKIVVFETPQSKYYFDTRKKDDNFKMITKGKFVVKKLVDEKKNKVLEAHFTSIDLGPRLRILYYVSAFLLLSGAVSLLGGLSSLIFNLSISFALIIIFGALFLNSPIFFYLVIKLGLKNHGYKGKVRLRY